jgi:hypothetical protein
VRPNEFTMSSLIEASLLSLLLVQCTCYYYTDTVMPGVREIYKKDINIYQRLACVTGSPAPERVHYARKMPLCRHLSSG